MEDDSSIDRWTDTEIVVRKYNGVLLSYKKECIWVSSNEVDETRTYYTEWSKPEREMPIQYINAYMEFKKMVTMSLYVRQIKRHRYKEQTLGVCGRRRGWDDIREWHWNMYITICKIDDLYKFDAWSGALKAGALGQPRGIGWGRRWEGGSGWRDICTPLADSCWHMAKSNTILSIISLQLE